MENEAFDLLTLPKSQEILCKWVYKTKRDENGEDIKYKARSVVEGFTQNLDTNYDEKFSPVVKHITLDLFWSSLSYS